MMEYIRNAPYSAVEQFERQTSAHVLEYVMKQVPTALQEWKFHTAQRYVSELIMSQEAHPAFIKIAYANRAAN